MMPITPGISITFITPVKRGLVADEWLCSTFYRFVRMDLYPGDWAGYA
jgi:hypothetical protein